MLIFTAAGLQIQPSGDNMGKTVDMYPRKGNSGYNVQHNFTDSQRFNAVKGFYDLHPVKYYDARFHFYKNNGIIFQWRPW